MKYPEIKCHLSSVGARNGHNGSCEGEQHPEGCEALRSSEVPSFRDVLSCFTTKIVKSEAEKELEEMEKQCDAEEKKYNELKKRTEEQTLGYFASFNFLPHVHMYITYTYIYMYIT